MRLTQSLHSSGPMHTAVPVRHRNENTLLAHTGCALVLCTFALLTWALPTFGHDTPSILSGEERHVPPKEAWEWTSQNQLYPDPLSYYFARHWHLTLKGKYPNQLGGSLQCIIDSYDPATDTYSRWAKKVGNSWQCYDIDTNTPSDSSSDPPADQDPPADDTSADQDPPADQDSPSNPPADQDPPANPQTNTQTNPQTNTQTNPPANTPSNPPANHDSPAQQAESNGADSEPGPDGPAPQSVADGAAEKGNDAVEERATAPATEQSSDSQEAPEPDPLASLATIIDDVTSAAERGRMTFTVRLEPAPTAPTTVKYATASRTARAGEDYEVASGTLAFDAGQSTATFTVWIRRDAQDEPDETFGVRIVHPSTGALLAEATGTITDDDGTTPSEADSDGDDESTFGFAEAVEAQAYTAETAIRALELPEATGGQGEVTYRVSGLPAGLSFDAATRTISGTPEAATDGAVEVAYTAEDRTGAAATLTFSITVNPALSFGDFDLSGLN